MAGIKMNTRLDNLEFGSSNELLNRELYNSMVELLNKTELIEDDKQTILTELSLIITTNKKLEYIKQTFKDFIFDIDIEDFLKKATDSANKSELIQSNESGYFIAKNIIRTGVPVIEYDIYPYLRTGGLLLIGGEPESKKTMIAVHFANCLVKGAKAFDKFECKKKIVLYLDFENGLIPLANRIKSLFYGNFGLTIDDLENFHFIINPAVRFNEESSKLFLEQWINRTKADVIVIDSFVGCFSGDENKSSDVRNVFNNLREFMVQGKSFIVLHHTKKDNLGGMNAIRGSSDFGGMAECVLMLKPNKNFSNVELVKHRHMGKEGIPNWSFEVVQVFGDKSDYLKLKYHERDPEQQDKFTQCYDDLLVWIGNTHSVGDVFRSGAAEKAMKSEGGFSRNMVYDALKKLQKDGIIKKDATIQGKWTVC